MEKDREESKKTIRWLKQVGEWECHRNGGPWERGRMIWRRRSQELSLGNKYWPMPVMMMMAMTVTQEKAEQTAPLNFQKSKSILHRSKQEAPSGALSRSVVFSYFHNEKEMD